jgi:hypothetical protein
LAQPSIVGALLDHQLTSQWTQEDKEYRLKELGMVLFSGMYQPGTSLQDTI